MAIERHPLPGIYPNSRLGGGKQVFSIHPLFVQTVAMVTHSQFWECWEPP